MVHVGHVGHGVAALGADEAGDALRIVGADIGDDDIQAVACKQPRIWPRQCQTLHR